MVTFMNRKKFIGECKNISFRSMLNNRAPLFTSEMTLFSSSYISKRTIDGDPDSDSYGNLSPPTTNLMRHVSSLSGR